MKRILMIVIAIVMCLSLVACTDDKAEQSTEETQSEIETEETADDTGEEVAEQQEEAVTKTAGICWYKFSDTFLANARMTMDNISAEDGTITVNNADTNGEIATQTSNMNNFYTQGVDYLVLNNINTNATSELVQMAKDEEVTLLIINTTSPSDEDFENYEDLYYVSSAAEQSGRIMGEAAVKYWNENPEADRNGNGKMDYIMLLGMQGNYDTEMRSGKSIEAIEDAGIELNNIGGELICDWSRAKAQETVAALLANFSDEVDFIFACNDDMALGAIEALKAGGYFKDEDGDGNFDEGTYLPVCGVDATVVGCEALEEGTLLVTSLNNPVLLAKATYKVMWLTANGQEVTTETMDMDGVEVKGHRVWLGYTAITKDNVADASYEVTDTSF